MQNQRVHQQHPIFNLETGGTVVVSSPPQVQPSIKKVSLVFGAGLLFLGLVTGIAIGTIGADRRVADAQDSLKLEQLQRQAMQSKIDKFCSENGGQDGK
ncbi:MAG: hypothetical protein ACBR12_14310 [Microcoleus sp.]